MKRFSRQRGMAGLVLAGLAAMGALSYVLLMQQNLIVSTPKREAATRESLRLAKEAVLGWVAQSAASTGELYPGRLPCPERLLYANRGDGTSNQGLAGPFGGEACDPVGRLPWKTLGVGQLRDGYGEPLWYAVPTGTWALTNVGDALVINPASTNRLTYQGTANSVVAVIIAPGPPLRTAGLGTPASGCTAVTQTRVAASAAATAASVSDFLECGNESGNYILAGTEPWGNDRTISITAAEVITAIAGAVQDRIQRQVAPKLNDHYVAANAKWGRSFLPYASRFNTVPSANALCGTTTERFGLLPTVMTADSNCTQWSLASVTPGALNVYNPAATTCSWSNTTGLTCTVSVTGVTILFGLILQTSATITVEAPLPVAMRDPITISDITLVSPSSTSLSGFSITYDNAAHKARATFTFNRSVLISLGTSSFTFRVAVLPNAAFLSDSSVTWWLNNGWNRYTYYSVATAAVGSPTGTCTSPTYTGCLTTSNLPSSNGLTNDKRFVLSLMGPPVGSQTQPSDQISNYVESQSGDTFDSRVTATSNDRLATCPFQQTLSTGVTVPICP